ncbi:DUF2752 domain-containing protein [Streptomyces sp. RPA4-5]|uniref:DUF2752 domain-containing protein n=1 Tax=Streptomyces TaxID=1883 RepID=UPI00143E7C67|nr:MULTISPECIES: DUF2752 domain-containing protein [Streptomyces]MCX4639709.1 DUF2752 domain-containing protein [Streptomyces platensis]QIY56794.1 DUF2752 domain-containing protein [Streptomyces sp. RPA4-5]WJY39720.1 DUF2752 domain-containing protein [Streptomyces sp. P9-2B-2]
MSTGESWGPAEPVGPTGAAVRRRTLRRAALTLGPGAAAAVYLWHTDPHQPGQLLIPCPFKWITGLLCPLCGGTRMAYDLMHGEVVTAFHDNAVLLTLGGPVVAYAVVRWLVAGLRGRVYRPRLSGRGNAVVLGIAAVWMLARNLVG